MVAKTTLISKTIESTEGFNTSIFFVFLQKEGGIVDIGC
jgi:hypothetical protein